ncbi:MAG: diguanylate cyclase, partial [Desulfuromonas sp.]
MAQKKKILIVDDEFFFRTILNEGLKDRYDVIEACNGEEGVAKALEHQPDLIIMDVEMPVMNGLDACRAIKEKPETRKIPVVMFTSLSRRDELINGLNAGADDYVTKP